MSPIASGDRGGVEQDKEPSQKQAAPAEVQEQALRRRVKRCSPEVAQRSPTSPETNLESRAMQVRVPWTQAWLWRQTTPTACTTRKTVEKAAGSALQSCSSRLCYFVAVLQASSAVSSRFLGRR
ncbi:hypothetical protein NDU88_000716 [Pleurodeles waltl]|uniref:Uncharacterized protein n=1 Tax=Pleurodeles waltl TaxID=8319 RepID=A0AAV7RAU0_PLEWA|nr:hypothetical protein NDU88_000716 [Pleurodeles waltl]